MDDAIDRLKTMASHMHSSPISKFERRVTEVNTDWKDLK